MTKRELLRLRVLDALERAHLDKWALADDIIETVDEPIRADERERIAAAIEAEREQWQNPDYDWADFRAGMASAARIARNGGRDG